MESDRQKTVILLYTQGKKSSCPLKQLQYDSLLIEMQIDRNKELEWFVHKDTTNQMCLEEFIRGSVLQHVWSVPNTKLSSFVMEYGDFLQRQQRSSLYW